MAFTAATFSFEGGHFNSGIQREHRYETADLDTVVDTAGYFNDLSNQLQVNDLILATTDTGGTAQRGFFTVLSNAAGVVDVSDMFVITATDTD